MADGEKSTELLVIGAGPGGYAAAFLAADLGLRVTLVDPAPEPGGVCLYDGCIPSKTLLHVAKVLDEARQATDWGVTFGLPEIDLARLRGWKDEVVGRLTGGLGELARRRDVEYLRGRARLEGPRLARVMAEEGEDLALAFDNAIIATGSRPIRLPGWPDSPRVMDSTAALALERTPETLLVVGGGYIGLELGSVYAALGSQVTVVEMLDGLLPGVDRDLVRPLQRRLETVFQEILLKTTVREVQEEADGLRVTLAPAGGGGEPVERRFDQALVAVGRRPVSEGLGLETTRAKTDARGFLLVDEQRRTAEPSLWAIGDVAGQPMLAHKASHEGRVAARAIAGQKVAYEPQAIPAVVFTDPEVAWCGLTEDEARAAGREVTVARFPWAASGRAATLGSGEGMTKLVIDPASERVLGVGIVGSGAGELIAEGALAVEMAALAADLALTIHAHPTLSETLMESAEALFGQATHLYRPRRGGAGG